MPVSPLFSKGHCSTHSPTLGTTHFPFYSLPPSSWKKNYSLSSNLLLIPSTLSSAHWSPQKSSWQKSTMAFSTPNWNACILFSTFWSLQRHSTQLVALCCSNFFWDWHICDSKGLFLAVKTFSASTRDKLHLSLSYWGPSRLRSLPLAVLPLSGWPLQIPWLLLPLVWEDTSHTSLEYFLYPIPYPKAACLTF